MLRKGGTRHPYNSSMQKHPNQIAQTSCGAVEYAWHGAEHEPTVIVSHSTSGGYDQGLAIAERLRGFQGIAVSRAGYLRTPLKTAATPIEMADAYAALLDSLSIERSAVMGLSGGGMSAAYFALRHADRCWGMVLADAITKAPPKSSAKIVEMGNSLPDGLAWLVTRLAVHVALPLMFRDVETRSLVRVFFENNPISERRAGIQNDLENLHSMNNFPWEDVQVPTLLIHGDKDNLIPVEHSREAVRRIPNAQLVVIQGGRHECLVSRQRETFPLVNDFLKKNQPM
jgi:pimeloyl-ACP methyl ester carboxylesterase